VTDLFELGSDTNLTYWLDLTTGRHLTSAAPAISFRGPARNESEFLAPVVAVLAEHGHGVDGTRKMLNARIQGCAAIYEVGIFANADHDIVCSYTFVPTPVSTGHRAAVASAMTGINAHMWLGNFEMNAADGFMRFRFNADVAEVDITRAMAERLVFEGCRAWDDHYDSLMRAAGRRLASDRSAR
jgi:hypothetical protein